MEKKARKLSKENNLKMCGKIGFLEHHLNLIPENNFQKYLKLLKTKRF